MPGILENLGLRYGWPEDYPALGFDPAPGRCAQIDALQKVFGSTADRIDRLAHTAASTGTSSNGWQGEAGTAFRSRMKELHSTLVKMAAALRKAAPVLADWSTTLASMQAKAREYDRQAAQAKLHQNDAVTGLFVNFDGASDLLERASREAAAAKEAARRLQGEHEAAVAAVASALRDVIDAAPSADALADLLEDAVLPAEKRTKNVITRKADSLVNYGDVYGDIGALTGITSLMLLGASIAALGTEAGAVVIDSLLLPATAISAEIATVSTALSVGLHAVGGINNGDISATDVIWDTYGVMTLKAGQTGHFVQDVFESFSTTTAGTLGQKSDLESHWDTYWEPQTSRQETIMDFTKGSPLDFPVRMSLAFRNAWNEGQREYEQAITQAVEQEAR